MENKRVWSTDWFLNKEKKVGELKKYLAKRKQEVNAKTSSQEVISAVEPSVILDERKVEIGSLFSITYLNGSNAGSRKNFQLENIKTQPKLNNYQILLADTPLGESVDGLKIKDEGNF